MSRQKGLISLLVMAQLVNLAVADVYIMTSAYILDPLPDIPADFGPDIPDEGVEGVLRLADPEDACSPLTFSDNTPWIALIARQQQLHPNNCTFDVKVLNAQNAGAMAAIVYDDVYESLIIMSKPKGHPDPAIPSVFVSQKAGIIMRKLMMIDTIRVRITPLSNVAWLSMLMSAFLGVLALGVVLATFYVMRSWSMWLTGMHVRGTVQGGGAQGGADQAGHARQAQQQDPGLPAEALRQLPVLVFEPSASSRGARTASRPASVLGGAAMSSTSSRMGSLSRVSAMGAAVWTEEATADEEMQPFLLVAANGGGGDVEEGCGRYGPEGGEVEEEEEEELMPASRSSSDSGCGIASLRLPRPPGAHAGETKRVCAICLESYVEGEKVRVLPCTHRFHMGCVDQWLGTRRYCPVCKHDASQPLPHLPARGAGGAGVVAGGSDRGAAGAGAVNGWTLLFHGLVDLIRHPRVYPSQRPRPGSVGRGNTGVGGQQLQQRAGSRARSRRQYSQQRLAAAHAAAAAPELQEPLMPVAGPAQIFTADSDAAATVASSLAPAGDEEAPGPSRPMRTGSSTALGNNEVGTGSAPIAIPANNTSPVDPGTTPTESATAEPSTGQHQQEQQQQQAGQAATSTEPTAAAAASGGPAARMRAALAGLWRSAVPGDPAASSTLQYPSTL